MKKPRYVFPGRFGALTGRPGDLMKNLETPGKTGRVGRYAAVFLQAKKLFPTPLEKVFRRKFLL